MSALGLGLADADAIAKAALERSGKLGKAISVAVVDAGGFVLVVKRTDGARPLTPNIAISKAYSAAVMQRPTKMLKGWQESNPNFFASLSQHGSQPIVATEGGVTVKRDGVIVGGLGIAGGTADEDQMVADEVLGDLGYELEFPRMGQAGRRTLMANDYKYHMDHHASVVRPPGYETDLDHAVDEAILRQRRLGLLALSDGELRRRNDLAVLYDAVDGFGEPTGPGPLAELVGSGHAAEVRPIVAAPTLRGRLTEAESTRLGQVEERGTMIALPAPGYVAALAGDPTYGTALAEIVREELVAINADGVPFAILRNPAIGFLLTVDGRARAVELGIDPDKTVTSMLEADNAVVDGLAGRVDDTFRVSLDVTTAGTATGGYDRAAVEDFLERQGFGRICVEQPIDPARRFPLDLVPSGLVVSLGVIDVSSPELEDVDEVVGRIDEAAEVLDIDDIAVATNGGFHAVSGIPADVGHAKLQRVEMVARYFWGNEL